MTTQIGEIVQFKIEDDRVRPLLVVSGANTLVSGELFLDWEQDTGAVWVRDNQFYAPHQGQRTAWVQNVSEGPGVGQWLRRSQSGNVQFTQPPPRKRILA